MGLARGSFPGRLALFSLTLLLGGDLPAWAGSYQLSAGYPQGSGTLTVTGSSGSQTESLTRPEFSRSLSGGQSLQFEYVETFRWEWVPAEGMTVEEDPPVETHLALLGDGVQEFYETSGLEELPGSGSSSVTLGGDSTSASASGGPQQEWQTQGVGAYYLGDELVLTGASPEITMNYSASCSIQGPLLGQIEFRRNLGGKYIVIDSATAPKPGPASPAPPSSTASVLGRWSTVPGYGVADDDYRILIEWRVGQSGDYSAGATLGPPLRGIPSDWTASFGIPYADLVDIRAVLEARNPATGNLEQPRPYFVSQDRRPIRWQ